MKGSARNPELLFNILLKKELKKIIFSIYIKMESPDRELKKEASYVDMRLTFSLQDKNLTCLEDKAFRNNCFRISKCIIEDLKTLCYFNKYTGGIEEMNKCGDTCKMHLHLRYETLCSTKVEDQRKTVKTKLERDYNQDTKGNSNFMMKRIAIDYYDDYFQYPLKQKLNKSLCGGFSEDQLIKWHEAAKSCFIKTMEVNQAKKVKREDNDTLFERVFQKCKDCKNEWEIANEFLDYYMENNKPINTQIIKGYVLTASLKNGILKKKDFLFSLGFTEPTE